MADNIIEGHIRFTDETTEALNSAQRRVREFASSIQRIGREMMVMGGAIVGGVGLSVRAFSQFEYSMALVNTLLEENSQLLPELSLKVREMAIKYGESANILSRALYEIISSNISAEESMYLLEEAVKSARAGMTDTFTSVSALITILKAYQRNIKDAGDISDWLFTVVKYARTTFPEFASNIGVVASAGGLLKFPLEDLGSAFAVMTLQGLDTAMAMTSLNALLRAFISPTAEAVKTAREFGVELSAETLRQEGLINILKKFEGASEEQIASIFGNIRAFRGVASILQDVNAYEEIRLKLINRAGEGQKAYNKTTETLTYSFAKFKEAMSEVLISIGEQLRPLIDSATKTLTKFITIWESFPKPLKSFIAYGLLISGVLLLLGGGFLFVGGKILEIMTFLPMMILKWNELMVLFSSSPELLTKIALGLQAIASSLLQVSLYMVGLILLVQLLGELKGFWDVFKTSKTSKDIVKEADELLKLSQEGKISKEEFRTRYQQLINTAQGRFEELGVHKRAWALSPAEYLSQVFSSTSGKNINIKVDANFTKSDEVVSTLNKALSGVVEGY